MNKLTMPQSVLVSVVVIVMGVLAYFDKGFDTVGLIAVLAAIGLVAVKQGENAAETKQVKENTNGNTTKLLDLVERQGELLAKMQPPAAEEDKKEF